jgi:hypothetical protein
MSAPRIFASQLSMSEGNRRGNRVGEQGNARGVPPLLHLARHESGSMTVRLAMRCSAPTSISAVGC